VLVPALGKARVASQSAIAMSNVRQLSTAQSTYAARSDDWMAGPNTSGVRGIIEAGANYLYSTSATTPTTTHDWISPCLGDELDYSPNRAERTFQIFSRFRCPRANEASQLFPFSGGPADRADFQKIVDREGGFGQVSYLAPATFHYAGPVGKTSSAAGGWAPRQLISAFGDQAYKRVLTSAPNPFMTPDGFRPQMSLIKNASMKAVVADGTRYVATGSSFGSRNALLDFDFSPAPSIYGSFLEAPATFHDCRAYGRKYGASVSEINVDYSMRFPGRQMHVGFFDGHAERITSTRAWSDATIWHPSGSEFTGTGATPEINNSWKSGQRTP
jgi:prepilin-type processing-associated H-X9-DG protein